MKVVILAGGLGTRLGEYTHSIFSKTNGKNWTISNNCSYNESLP